MTADRSFDALHRIAVHIVARARLQATGRFSLRVTPGGFGTPDFGDDGRRVRVAGSTLIVESDRPGAASIRSAAIGGSTLRALASLAAVDLEAPLDVGHDTPALGDVDANIDIDVDDADATCAWYAAAASALDAVIAALPPDSVPTLPRLWPEHFDVAIEAVARPGVRVNLGASPGDSFLAEPYLYVGPWTSDRPGDPAFWNAPFGAVRPASSLAGDRRAEGAAFLLDGFSRLV